MGGHLFIFWVFTLIKMAENIFQRFLTELNFDDQYYHSLSNDAAINI